MHFRSASPRCHLHVLTLAALLVLGGPLAAQPAKEKWTCSLDLHQGDQGTLTFVKAGTTLSGETVVQRREIEMRHEISGSWEGEQVRFRRNLSGSSYQPFVGISARTEEGEVKMGGRFANAFAGVWSADCELAGAVGGGASEGPRDRLELRRTEREMELREELLRERARAEVADHEPPRVSVDVEGILVRTVGDAVDLRASAEDDGEIASVTVFLDGRAVRTCNAWLCPYRFTADDAGRLRLWATAEDAAGNEGRSEEVSMMVHPTSKPGPSLNTRAQPYEPTTEDRVRFEARASHSSGVESVTFHVDGRAVKTCRTATCVYVGGPYPAGEVRWRVSAKSRDGGETYGYDSELAITAAPAGGSCVLRGRATGPGADVAHVFFANIYGPDDPNRFRESARFDRSGRFRSSGLPDGQYRLVLDTRADLAVGVEPRQTTVRCSGGRAPERIFEFR